MRAAVHTQAEADARAKAILDERAQDFVTGSGECIGLPEIVPDINVALGGLGRGVQQDLLGLARPPTSSTAAATSTTFKVQETTV